MSDKEKPTPKEIPFTIDKTPHKLPADQNPTSGQFLRNLEPKVTEEYDLWLRARGQEDDQLVEAETSVEVRPGDHFYTAKRVITPGM